MADLNREGSASAQPPRTSTNGADYLNTHQLFSQDESQTQELDQEGVAEEQRIQRAFLRATEQHRKGRRVTFTEAADDEAVSPEDGDELHSGSDDLDASLTIEDILANLGQGADQFAIEVQARPNYVYNLMGKLCAQLHLLKEHNDLLHQSNARNKTMREQLASQHTAVQERLQEATEKITELSQEEQDPQLESRATVQLAKMKEKNQWYADTMKEKEQTLNTLNNQVASLATDNDELSAECDRLKDDLSAANKQAIDVSARGRPSSRNDRRDPSASLSPYSKAHGMGPPTVRRRAAHSESRAYVARSESRNRSEIAQRAHREFTTNTNNSRLDREQSAFTTASHASVNLDPNSSKAIQVDRSVKDPDKFKGEQGTFYPWLTALTLKLSTAVFRTEGDGLRYVQGFIGGPPWALVAPRIPTLGGWGKPCPNPFTDVDSLMQLLAERYGEDNTEERAMTAMVTLRQADKQDFNIFYAKYQEHQAYCPLADRQEVHRLQGKLNSRFRNKLADGMDVASLKELVGRCTRLQTQWESMDAEYNRQPRSESKNRRNNKRKDDEPTTGPSSRGAAGPSRITLPENELPREFRNLPPLTSDLRQTLRNGGGCYKCRKMGHVSTQRDKCPLAQVEDAYEKRTKVNQVQVEGDADSEQQQRSGNGMATR